MIQYDTLLLDASKLHDLHRFTFTDVYSCLLCPLVCRNLPAQPLRRLWLLLRLTPKNQTRNRTATQKSLTRLPSYVAASSLRASAKSTQPGVMCGVAAVCVVCLGIASNRERSIEL